MIIALTAKILASILQLYKYLLIARILLSWFPQILYSPNPLSVLLLRITEPPMYYMKKWFPFLQIGMIDFSPIVLFIAVDYLIAWCIRVAMNYSLAG